MTISQRLNSTLFLAVIVSAGNLSHFESSQVITQTLRHNGTQSFYGALYFGNPTQGNDQATFVFDTTGSYLVSTSTFSQECAHQYYNELESSSAVNVTSSSVTVNYGLEDFFQGYEIKD